MLDALKQLAGVMRSEADFTNSTRAKLYSAANGDASEYEVSMLLAACVYALKPMRVLETGCHMGQTTRVLGHAVQMHDGRVVALDINRDRVKYVQGLCDRLPVDVVLVDSRMFISNQPFDFVYIDCVIPRQREKVLSGFIGHRVVRPGTFVAIHDTAPHHGGYQQYLEFLAMHVQIDTPRGLLLGIVR